MKLKSLLLISAMAIATPALASIPSSPEEREATRQLNLQQLAAAQQAGPQTATDAGPGFTAATNATPNTSSGDELDLTDDNNPDDVADSTDTIDDLTANTATETTNEATDETASTDDTEALSEPATDEPTQTAMAEETSPAEAYVTDTNPSEDIKPDVNPDITQQGGPSSGSNVDAPDDQEQDFAANTATGVALTTVSNPAATLDGLTIKSSGGEEIGTVDDIVLGNDGEPTAVEVTVEGGATVSVAASNFVFDKSSNMLITHLSRAQIDAQPPA